MVPLFTKTRKTTNTINRTTKIPTVIPAISPILFPLFVLIFSLICGLMWKLIEKIIINILLYLPEPCKSDWLHVVLTQLPTESQVPITLVPQLALHGVPIWGFIWNRFSDLKFVSFHHTWWLVTCLTLFNTWTKWRVSTTRSFFFWKRNVSNLKISGLFF